MPSHQHVSPTPTHCVFCSPFPLPPLCLVCCCIPPRASFTAAPHCSGTDPPLYALAKTHVSMDVIEHSTHGRSSSSGRLKGHEPLSTVLRRGPWLRAQRARQRPARPTCISDPGNILTFSPNLPHRPQSLSDGLTAIGKKHDANIFIALHCAARLGPPSTMPASQGAQV